jgi:hypothetical protein
MIELYGSISQTYENTLKEAVAKSSVPNPQNIAKESSFGETVEKYGAAAGIRTRVIGSGSRSPNQILQSALVCSDL